MDFSWMVRMYYCSKEIREFSGRKADPDSAADKIKVLQYLLYKEEVEMKKNLLMGMGIALGAMMLAAAPVCAETLTTADGVLSIETPSEAWMEVADSNHWFTVTDGRNNIIIDHFSNGESLPSVNVADDTYPAIYDAFVSTKNEVFVVEGRAATQEELKSLMETIGTVKVLKYDTKTRIEKKAPVKTFGFRKIDQTYYVTSEELNVRSGCSTDDAVIGTLYFGNAIIVDGAVTLDGADYGWYQITFDGRTAYVSAKFLSQTMPAGGPTPTPEQEKVQCEFCGEWFNAGNDYRNHVMAAHTLETEEMTGADFGERTEEEMAEEAAAAEIGD